MSLSINYCTNNTDRLIIPLNDGIQLISFVSMVHRLQLCRLRRGDPYFQHWADPIWAVTHPVTLCLTREISHISSPINHGRYISALIYVYIYARFPSDELPRRSYCRQDLFSPSESLAVWCAASGRPVRAPQAKIDNASRGEVTSIFGLIGYIKPASRSVNLLTRCYNIAQNYIACERS